VLARALDDWWRDSGEPERWTVVDAGAGPGRLLPAVLAAEPDCRGAMEAVAVDRSPAQRARHRAPLDSRVELPEGPMVGVVLANELLDNVPWRLLERDGRGWSEVFVDASPDGDLVEALRAVGDDADERADAMVADPRPGARIPIQDGAVAWLTDALERVERGRIVVLDFGSTTAELAGRPEDRWIRTYRGHRPGSGPLDRPGSQDVTVEVAVDQLAAVRRPDENRSQSQFLRDHGIEELVAEGRRVWAERAAVGDLAALAARSRIGEAAALTDPGGLGAFRVLEWSV
jgi:SAM-dependent MidA family methyltransferase